MFLDSLKELIKSDTDGKLILSLGALFGAGLNTYEQKPKKEKTVPLRQ